MRNTCLFWNDPFESLLEWLTQASVLRFPRFDRQTGTMSLQTNASGVGLGVILVIGYANCTLLSLTTEGINV